MDQVTLSRPIRKGRRPDKAGIWVRPLGTIWAAPQSAFPVALRLAMRAARMLRSEIEILEIRGKKRARHFERVIVKAVRA